MIMKSPLTKLRKFAAVRNHRKAQKPRSAAAVDEFDQAAMNMDDMRDCYERLLSAAASTANNVYEFSESLQEMGECLLEKTALNDDEQTGKVLLMLGKVQFELQKLVDGYRSHISQTITIPSESLLNELRYVEDMKKLCDDKREMFEELKNKHKGERRFSASKDECFSSLQLQELQSEYEEEANAFVLRMKSLKQGQSQSFLTQASRHYAAQLYFFRRAVRSLEAIEPHVTSLAKQYHIDYQFSGSRNGVHECDGARSDEDDDTEDGSESCISGTLSTVSQNLMEVDSNDAIRFPDRKPEKANEILGSMIRNSFSFSREVPAISKSAPLFPRNKLNSADGAPQLRPSPSSKLISYVLPTPDETRRSFSGKIPCEAPLSRKAPTALDSSGVDKPEKLQPKDKSGSIILPIPLPPPLTTEGASLKQLDPNTVFYSYTKKARVHAFSGPLPGKPSRPQNISTTHSAFPPFYSQLLQPSSNSKLPSNASPTLASLPPHISELHKLPRPPGPGRPARPTAHSGPIISGTATTGASRYPAPPRALPRSYSIPSRGQLQAPLQRLPEGSLGNMAENASPPVTTVYLKSIRPASPS